MFQFFILNFAVWFFSKLLKTCALKHNGRFVIGLYCMGFSKQFFFLVSNKNIANKKQ